MNQHEATMEFKRVVERKKKAAFKKEINEQRREYLFDHIPPEAIDDACSLMSMIEFYQHNPTGKTVQCIDDDGEYTVPLDEEYISQQIEQFKFKHGWDFRFVVKAMRKHEI